ncbi:hypothetical protein ACFL4V_01790 [Candidatus Latescibacterota bacterium]
MSASKIPSTPDPRIGKNTGVIPPYCPPDYKHVYWFYAICLDPKAAGVDVEPRMFRISVEKSLYMEGLMIGQWQTIPVPAQDLFQSKLGYGASNYPWAFNEDKAIVYDYNPDNHPVTQEFCDTYTNIHGITPPNDLDLMGKIIEGFPQGIRQS